MKRILNYLAVILVAWASYVVLASANGLQAPVNRSQAINVQPGSGLQVSNVGLQNAMAVQN